MTVGHATHIKGNTTCHTTIAEGASGNTWVQISPQAGNACNATNAIQRHTSEAFCSVHTESCVKKVISRAPKARAENTGILGSTIPAIYTETATQKVALLKQ